jgi:RNA polymerase sigma factor (sigma-70 family)
MAAGGLDAASDLALGQAFRDGDEAALAALYDRHLRAVYDFVARVVRDPASAEDLTQMTFVRAWEGRDKLRDPARVKAWLFTIAHNLALNHVTRGRKLESIDDQFDLATPAAGPEAELEAKDAAQLVWAAAASLEPRQYAVLDLSLRRDLATPEIAEVLGVSSSHAAVLVNRAREALGNAVRYLLVARKRDHCPRLAELVPSGLQSLTPDQRTTVDRHMRRCPDCQGLAHRLTHPAELFGGLLPLPVPGSLRKERREFVLVAAHRPEAPARSVATWRPQRPRRDAALAGLALLLLALLGGEVYLARPAPALRAAGQAAGLRGIFGLPSDRPNPSPSPTVSPSPTGSPTASPGDAGATDGAGGSPAGTFGQSTLGSAGHGTAGTGSSSQPGTGAVPGPVPPPTTPPQPVPPPPRPAAFAVTSLQVTSDDSAVTGCIPNSLSTYVCSFTVTAKLANAGNGSKVSGTLTAVAWRPGQSQTSEVPFAMAVPAGAPMAQAAVQATFGFPPCRSPSGPPPGSTALAATQQPNTAASAPVAFGALSPC